ncbi:energy transducer TonB family protein [Bartonella sp. CB175]|uniref:energy transducer TonB family protein n=1 Tax=Bartonella sp. CB175 TaxID=3112256 RepID=UPI00300DEA89
MNFANIGRSLTLWFGSFLGAFSLHIGLGAQFYFWDNPSVSNGMLSQTVMLTFAQDQEIAYPDTDITSENTDTENIFNADSDSKALPSDFSEQDPEVLEPKEEVQEESQSIAEKNDFIMSIPKIEKKKRIKKTTQKPKPVVKQLNAKVISQSTFSRGGDTAALESALLAEWLAKVQAQLEKQKNYVVRQYTSRAKGTVQLEFRVHEQGGIFSSRISLSSGNQELDRLAMAALKRVGTFPFPPPSKVNKIMRISLIFS